MKQFGNPLILTRPPLSTKPPISEQFFHDPLFVQISKTRTRPPPLSGGGGEIMTSQRKTYEMIF